MIPLCSASKQRLCHQLEHILRSPFLKEGPPRSANLPDCHAMLQRHVSHDSPTTSRDLRYSGRISSTPGAFAPRSPPGASMTLAREMNEPVSDSPVFASSWEDVTVRLRRFSKCSIHRLAPPYTPRCKQCWWSTASPAETPGSLPEFLRGRPIVHGLSELV